MRCFVVGDFGLDYGKDLEEGWVGGDIEVL